MVGDLFHIKDPALAVAITFASIAVYNALEILFCIFTTFKSYRGLYFWSMVVATSGLIFQIAFGAVYVFTKTSWIPSSIFLTIGSWAVLVGQPLVLYSRLHLVVPDTRKTRWVLYMIITVFCLTLLPYTIIFFVALGKGQDPRYYHLHVIFDKVLAVGGCVEEFIICGMYLYEAIRSLKPVMAIKGRQGRRVIINLIITNVIVVVLTATIMVDGFKSFFTVTMGYTPFAYSIKLKLEFFILNQLVGLVQQSPCLCGNIASGDSSQDAFRLNQGVPVTDPNSNTDYSRRGSEQTVLGNRVNCAGVSPEYHYHQIAMIESQASVPTPPRALSSDSIMYTRAGLSTIESATRADV